MDSLPPLPHLPIVPESILRAHRVLEPGDARFRVCARLLQALWREDRDLPIGTHIAPDGTRRKLGSRITKAAGAEGANFLSAAVTRLVRREVIYREVGAFIDEQRLFCNLLSSMPLCFNLLGPWKLDLKLAARILHLICPDLGKVKVRTVLFEHSPGRGYLAYTGDGTAFDALIAYDTPQGRKGFIAIEVKYSETGHEPCPDLRPTYDEIASSSGLFLESSDPALRANPIQQLFREHCLAHTLIRNGHFDEGRLLVIAPRLNHLIQNMTGAYATHLQTPSPSQVPFLSITLEDLIGAMALAGEEDYARALYRRYCDFWLVDGEIELALADAATRHKTPGAIEDRSGLELIAGGRS